MRIWDIDPGYLNRQSLLGEHRELHGIVSIISNNKNGYSRHPETIRWVGRGWALKQRHKLLASEMSLRGYKDKSPVRTRTNAGIWPETFIDEPGDQFHILKTKYAYAGKGRIDLPQNAQQLWAQHKYSVLARDAGLYNKIGRSVSVVNSSAKYRILARDLIEILRLSPSDGGIRNALQHMWGHVSDLYEGDSSKVEYWTLEKLLRETRKLAMSGKDKYLISSTALGELGAWLK